MALALGPDFSQIWERSTSQRRVGVVDSAKESFNFPLPNPHVLSGEMLSP